MIESRRKFILTVRAIAEEVAKSAPINVEICVAQACLESAYGESALARKANNLFGIKASKSYSGTFITMPTGEWEKGKQIKITARFRSYPTFEMCIKDYAKLISTSDYYKGAREHANEARKYADGLKAWATDPNYCNKVYELACRLATVR